MKELRKPSPYPLHDTVSGVVDCFLVNDEIELAKFRIGYLKQVVNYFVIGESSLTHSGNSKVLYFAKSREAGNFLEENILVLAIWYSCSRRMPFLEVSFLKSVGLIAKCKYWLNGLPAGRKCKNRQ